MTENIKEENIAASIYLIRGEKVMMDFDLAMLYDVETKKLKQAVKRNIERFPKDFMFELTKTEFDNLRSQIVTSKTNESLTVNQYNTKNDTSLRSQNVTSKRGGTRFLPYAFTEQGVAMLSGILNSQRAIEVNIAIMRTFVKLRRLMLLNSELAEKLKELEIITKEKLEEHDEKIQLIFEAIKELITHQPKTLKKIGYIK
jgi:hypothetical protein